MIRLQSLTIKSKFKNLEKLVINFQKCNGITVLIGNNGSGKSNIIEALSSVFAGLYNRKDFSPNFSYELSYSKDEAPISISYDHTKQKNKYQFNLSETEDFLPSQVISIYSGEDLRLWNRYYFKFYDSYVKDVIGSKKRFSVKQKMEFINKYHWNIALLTMIVSDMAVSDILGDKKINKIKITLNKANIENIINFNNQKPNEVTRFVQGLFENEFKPNTEIVSRNFTIDIFRETVIETHSDLFRLLSIALLPKEESWKLIDKLELFFESGYSTEELSEGEKKQILIKFITSIYTDDNSLFLLDEPDCHIHVNNKEKIKELLYDIDSNAHVQSVLTTHSPTLTNCFQNENVYMLVNKEGKIAIEDKTKQDIINNLTGEYWNPHEQNIFLASDKKLILLVEGKHDKIHIQNAFTHFRKDYPNVDFDIFSLEGETNIAPMLRGLRDIHLVNKKTYIGIFDNDSAGEAALNKGGFDKQENSCGYRKLCQHGYEHNNFYAFSLPKPKEHKKGYTIENLFPSDKYEEAYKNALAKTLGHFSNKSIDDIATDIKLKSKNILGESSKSFSKDDFKNFKEVFDLISDIYKQSNGKTIPSKTISNSKSSKEETSKMVRTKPTKEKSDSSSSEAKDIKMVRTKFAKKSIKKEYSDEDHLKEKDANDTVRKIYSSLKIKIIKKGTGIQFNPQKHYISLRKDKNFAYFKIRKTKIQLVVMAEEKTIRSKIKHHEITSVTQSVKNYYNGECAKINLVKDTRLDEVVSLLIEVQA